MYVLTLLCSPGKNSEKDSGAVVHVTQNRLADLGKPRMGEITRTMVVVKESQEFKVSDVGMKRGRARVSL